MTLDSASVAGPSPMQTLAFALTGCMAMDVVHVIRKGRYELRGLNDGNSPDTRARPIPTVSPPSALHFTSPETCPARRSMRAIELSRAKYCSVWHSMRQDIELSVTLYRDEGPLIGRPAGGRRGGVDTWTGCGALPCWS